MRRPREPVVTVMWCVVAVIGLAGLALALLSLAWNSG